IAIWLVTQNLYVDWLVVEIAGRSTPPASIKASSESGETWVCDSVLSVPESISPLSDPLPDTAAILRRSCREFGLDLFPRFNRNIQLHSRFRRDASAVQPISRRREYDCWRYVVVKSDGKHTFLHAIRSLFQLADASRCRRRTPRATCRSLWCRARRGEPS